MPIPPRIRRTCVPADLWAWLTSIFFCPARPPAVCDKVVRATVQYRYCRGFLRYCPLPRLYQEIYEPDSGKAPSDAARGVA